MPPSAHKRRRLLPLGCLALLLTVTLLPVVVGDTVQDTGYELPLKHWGGTAVWAGDRAYYFDEGYYDPGEVLEWVPGEPIEVVDGVSYDSNYFPDVEAFWDGRELPDHGCPEGCAYLVGRSGILRYNPANDTITEVVSDAFNGGKFKMPSAVVWTGTTAYFTGECWTRRVFAFTPTNGTVMQLGDELPDAMCGTSGVWTGEDVYLFGGGDINDANYWDNPATRTVVRIDPSTNNVSLADAELPIARTATAAFWDGHHVFVVGGSMSWYPKNTIFRFHPDTARFVEMRDPLLRARSSLQAVWTGETAYFLDGFNVTGDSVHDITRYTLEPDAPRHLEAEPVLVNGTDAGVELTWRAPPWNSYSVLTDHRVYRKPAHGGSWSLVAEVPGTQTTYVDPAGDESAYVYRVSGVNANRDEGPTSKVAVVGDGYVPDDAPGPLTWWPPDGGDPVPNT